MKNNRWILLKTLLLSTSQKNVLKYSKDKKRKSRAIGNFIGLGCIYLLILVYCIMICMGFGEFGMIDSIPVMCALVISALALVFTFFKTNGYLFNFKEYDMLMSLPFEPKMIAGSKFMYMYVKSLPWYVSISVSMLIGYGIYAAPSFIVYPIWIILSLILPVIPMLIAAFLGFLIAKISAGFKKNNLIQTIITMIFIIICFCARFIIEAVFKNGQVEQSLESIATSTDKAADRYLPAKWFAGAIVDVSVSDMLLLVAVSILLFELLFTLVGRSYRQINSAMKSHAASKEFKMTAQKKKSLLNTIAYKEFKRMLGSTTYMTNIALGEVLAVILGLAALFVGLDKVIAIVTQGAPIDSKIIFPAIPFVIYLFIGMLASTACSPSLEGKNYWIVQSLPLDKRVLYKGKMLFNMYLTVPFMTFGIICLCISGNVPVLNTVLYIIQGVVLCAFSTAWGCVCGIKHMRLDWENEVEVVKQGSAVAIYLLPNMFITMGLIVGVVFLGLVMDPNAVTLLLTAVAAVLAVISYIRALKLGGRT